MAVIDKADEAQLLATIDRWVEREVAPRVKEFDHADRWPAELVEQMKELGLFGATHRARRHGHDPRRPFRNGAGGDDGSRHAGRRRA